MKRIVPVVALGAALMAAGTTLAATPTYKGTVGPGFTISMASKPTKAGKITLTVSDKAGSHNFHLRGPGGREVSAVKNGKTVKTVDTGVGATGTTSFTVTLKAGKYTFVCDPHSSAMNGSFTVK